MAEITRAILKGRLAGTVQTRNMFVGNVTLVGGDTYTDIAYGYVNAVLTPLLPWLSTLWQAESIQVQQRFGGSWVDLDENAVYWAGTGVSEMLPNAVAGVLIAKTGFKRQLGRKFIAGLTEAAVNGNTLVVAAAGAFATSLMAYVTTWTAPSGSAWAPGVLGKDGLFHIFLGGFVSGLLGSMRRRKPGLGI